MSVEIRQLKDKHTGEVFVPVTHWDAVAGKPTVAQIDDTTTSSSTTYSSSQIDLLLGDIQLPTQVNSDWNASSGVAQILNKPTLFSGDYNDLTNKPTIPSDYAKYEYINPLQGSTNTEFIINLKEKLTPGFYWFSAGSCATNGNTLIIDSPDSESAGGLVVLRNATNYYTQIFTKTSGHQYYRVAKYINSVLTWSDWALINLTDEKVKQTETNDNSEYRILLSNSTNDTSETNGIKKSAGLRFNPSTSTINTQNYSFDHNYKITIAPNVSGWYKLGYSLDLTSVNATSGILSIKFNNSANNGESYLFSISGTAYDSQGDNGFKYPYFHNITQLSGINGATSRIKKLGLRCNNYRLEIWVYVDIAANINTDCDLIYGFSSGWGFVKDISGPQAEDYTENNETVHFSDSFSKILNIKANKVVSEGFAAVGGGNSSSVWTTDGGTKVLGTAAEKNIPTSGNATSTLVVLGNDTRLTDEKVKQSNTTANSDYRVLLSNSANDTEETTSVKKSSGLEFNPSTQTLKTSNYSFGESYSAPVTGRGWYRLGYIASSQTTYAQTGLLSVKYKDNSFIFAISCNGNTYNNVESNFATIILLCGGRFANPNYSSTNHLNIQRIGLHPTGSNTEIWVNLADYSGSTHINDGDLIFGYSGWGFVKDISARQDETMFVNGAPEQFESENGYWLPVIINTKLKEIVANGLTAPNGGSSSSVWTTDGGTMIPAASNHTHSNYLETSGGTMTGLVYDTIHTNGTGGDATAVVSCTRKYNWLNVTSDTTLSIEAPTNLSGPCEVIYLIKNAKTTTGNIYTEKVTLTLPVGMSGGTVYNMIGKRSLTIFKGYVAELVFTFWSDTEVSFNGSALLPIPASSVTIN